MMMRLMQVAALALVALPAQAQVSFVADPASLAAMGPLTTLPVSGSQNGQFTSVLGDTTFSVTGAFSLQYIPAGFIGISSGILLNSSTAHPMVITLNGNYQLAGFTFGRFNPNSRNQPIRVNTNLGSYDFTVPMGSIFGGGAFTYAGFATSGSERITSVAFAGETVDQFSTDLGMAQVQYGNPGTVPEPASWAMLLAGFGLSGLMLRRRRLRVVSA
ncbi:hypothetical protein CAP39_12925 [Sphingomonas sp. IBVSS1]|nr:hypothetical protein CAP39_12925 [Sphingomonas sp. IBVSS1]